MTNYFTNDKMSDKDLHDARALDDVNFSDVHDRETLELSHKWLCRNPDLYTVLRDEDGRLVGYINFMPLKLDAYEKYRKGQLSETDITADDIARYEDFEIDGDMAGQELDALFCSLNIAKEHHNGRAFKVLMISFIEKIRERQNRGVKFGRVLADCVSEDGKRLVGRLGVTLPYQSHTEGAVLKEIIMDDILAKYANFIINQPVQETDERGRTKKALDYCRGFVIARLCNLRIIRR